MGLSTFAWLHPLKLRANRSMNEMVANAHIDDDDNDYEDEDGGRLIDPIDHPLGPLPPFILPPPPRHVPCPIPIGSRQWPRIDGPN